MVCDESICLLAQFIAANGLRRIPFALPQQSESKDATGNCGFFAQLGRFRAV
jgi:hypothetical protein